MGPRALHGAEADTSNFIDSPPPSARLATARTGRFGDPADCRHRVEDRETLCGRRGRRPIDPKFRCGTSNAAIGRDPTERAADSAKAITVQVGLDE
ncbi:MULTISPECIES: hypothetical protein [Methylobacterium]|uniref:hypothetical protein n=1 Tax=Methylobacterium TaxID=407 RepID=UPI0011C78FB0|nr:MULTISPECIES: hypothetical protein [Methylobacterium]TXM92228.1 hypothetical protein FV219_20375 [Methylobacterium sp. WL122]TXN77687.1 hypothetical protein FV234_23580 [Methylobacterium sp. WL8]